MARARGARAADNAQFEQTEVHVDAITTQPGQILGPPLPVRRREKTDNAPEEEFDLPAPGLVSDYLAPHPRGLANRPPVARVTRKGPCEPKRGRGPSVGVFSSLVCLCFLF
mgnify:CR=1 FL=1